jgi:(2S)-methylsuccinyl-CoA dehydrogenase
MPQAARSPADDTTGQLARCAAAADAARGSLEAARGGLAARLGGGRISNTALEAEQSAAHGLAWIATYVESLEQMRLWAGRLEAEGRFGEIEGLILRIAFGEYLAQLRGGIPMSQGEIVRAADLGLAETELRRLAVPAVVALAAEGNSDAARKGREPAAPPGARSI